MSYARASMERFSTFSPPGFFPRKRYSNLRVFLSIILGGHLTATPQCPKHNRMGYSHFLIRISEGNKYPWSERWRHEEHLVRTLNRKMNVMQARRLQSRSFLIPDFAGQHSTQYCCAEWRRVQTSRLKAENKNGRYFSLRLLAPPYKPTHSIAKKTEATHLTTYTHTIKRPFTGCCLPFFSVNLPQFHRPFCHVNMSHRITFQKQAHSFF